MIAYPTLSQAAIDAGVPPRFHYWRGRSGRRYLFTATDAADVADFDEGVAIAVRCGEIVWAGEIAAFAALPRSAEARRAALHVHLLAASAAEARAAIDDLRPAEACLRLAA